MSENQVQILCSFISTITGSVLKYFLSNSRILLGYGGLSNNADPIKNIAFCGLRTYRIYFFRRSKHETTTHFHGFQYIFQLLCWLLRNVSLVYATESSGGNSSMAGWLERHPSLGAIQHSLAESRCTSWITCNVLSLVVIKVKMLPLASYDDKSDRSN